MAPILAGPAPDWYKARLIFGSAPIRAPGHIVLGYRHVQSLPNHRQGADDRKSRVARQ